MYVIGLRDGGYYNTACIVYSTDEATKFESYEEAQSAAIDIPDAVNLIPLKMDIRDMKVDKVGVHMSHCNQGEYMGCCKYMEDDTCPALKNNPEQRQDSVTDQLMDLVKLANQNGMYDAADWIMNQLNK